MLNYNLSERTYGKPVCPSAKQRKKSANNEKATDSLESIKIKKVCSLKKTVLRKQKGKAQTRGKYCHKMYTQYIKLFRSQ